MKHLHVSEINGPRSYFTNFDHRIVQNCEDKITLKRDVERNLKILLLFKSKIVCAASHLVTEFTYEILKENPRLIQEAHIIPALRSDKENFLAIIKEKKNRDPALFLEENVHSTVRWDITENSNWFKDKFISEFNNPLSVIRQNLSPISSSVLEVIVKHFTEQKILSRNNISHISKLLKPNDRLVLKNYRELIYHISGARVVNCESALPQENYIDFNFTPERKACSLSEPQIAWKIFIELAFQSLHSRVVPIELIDSLSFNDIIEIRQPILDSSFQQKYDNLLKLVFDQHNLIGSDSLIESQLLDLIEGDIKDTFNAVFDREMPKFLKRNAFKNSGSLVSTSTSIALGLSSFTPGIGIIAGCAGVVKEIPAFLVNLRQTLKSADSLSSIDNYVKNRENVATKIISDYKFKDEVLLLDFIKYMTTSISHKIKV